MQPDPKTIYQVAAQFLVSAHRCGQEQETIKGRGSERLPVPQITSLAFAAELFLKALIAARSGGKAPFGHHLSDLYKLLSEEDRAWISDKVQREYQQFEIRLESVSKAFEQWRYIYEQDHLHVDSGFLGRFVHVVADRASKALGIDPKTTVPLVRPTYHRWWG